MFGKLQVRAASALFSIVSWIALGTMVYHRLEDWSWGESFYFTVVTLATVGYGDLHPTTQTSRMFTALFILSGVAVVLAALGVVGGAALERHEKRITHIRDSREDSDG